MFLFLVLCQLYLAVGLLAANNEEFLLKTARLPADRNFMPSLANGHLGYTVFGDSIYMNGVFNGRGGDSRRARIPNWLNLTVVSVSLGLGRDLKATIDGQSISYEMHLRDGYFLWRQNYTDAMGGLVTIEQRSYPHRYYDRALVYELLVERTNVEEALVLQLQQRSGELSDAFDFTSVLASSGRKALKGVTRIKEHEVFQINRREIFVIFSEEFIDAAKELQLKPQENRLYYRYVLTIDSDLLTAEKEMQDVLAVGSLELLSTHAVEWRKFWKNFKINIYGNLDLSQTINAGIFYLCNSLPSPNTNHPRTQSFYGLSPTGVGRGRLDADYQGHSFWDTEIWMFPLIPLISTDWAKSLLSYRFQRLPGAQFNAQLTGYRGARFPWESAFTGTEVINPCCPVIAAQQVHISADIALALRQFYAMTDDHNWLCDSAWKVLREIAEFLVSRVSWDEQTQKFHVNGVMGPDEDHENVTDNVYTNVAFKLALEFAGHVEGKCSPSSPKARTDHWLHVAEKLNILYDPELDYHPQHFGYNRSEKIKQADVILLGYPLLYRMNESTRANDLINYERVIRSSGPAMTWSMFAINFLDIGDATKADSYFEKSFKDYTRPEFRVWSETKLGFPGSANFLTGIGGFLQAIVNGYAGLRFYRERNASVMEIRRGRPLPASEGFTLQGLKFIDAKFDLNITANGTRILKCLEVGSICLELEGNGETYAMREGLEVTFKDSSPAYVRTTTIC